MAISRTESHSVRTERTLWAKARARATREGYKMNTVINELLEGYARGVIHMPKVQKQYNVTPATVEQDIADGK